MPLLPEEVLGPYRLWRAAAAEFQQVSAMFTEHLASNDLDGEELSDWVGTVETLLSFSPSVPAVGEQGG